MKINRFIAIFLGVISIALVLPAESTTLASVVYNGITLNIDGDRVISKHTISGVTHYNYDQNNVLQTQIDPNGVVGRYIYDSSGNLDRIEFSDNKVVIINYSRYDGIDELQVNTTRNRVRFSSALSRSATSNMKNTPSSIVFQNALNTITALTTCSLDTPDGCVVYVPGTPEDEGGGGGGGFGTGPRGGSSGGYQIPKGPGQPTQPVTVAECKTKTCDAADSFFESYCKTQGSPNISLCLSKATQYYANCLRSCETNDWSWLSTFNYYYK